MKTKNETSIPLTKLIPMYGKSKEQESDIKKTCDLLNSRIKAAMEKLLKDDEAEKTVDGWTATLSIRKTFGLKEEALIEFMRGKKEFEGCIKTKEYIDTDMLENILYTKKLPKKLIAELDNFRTVKKTQVLTIKKEKKDES